MLFEYISLRRFKYIFCLKFIRFVHQFQTSQSKYVLMIVELQLMVDLLDLISLNFLRCSNSTSTDIIKSIAEKLLQQMGLRDVCTLIFFVVNNRCTRSGFPKLLIKLKFPLSLLILENYRDIDNSFLNFLSVLYILLYYTSKRVFCLIIFYLTHFLTFIIQYLNLFRIYYIIYCNIPWSILEIPSNLSSTLR